MEYDIKQYKCISCGAPLKESLICTYCGSHHFQNYGDNIESVGGYSSFIGYTGFTGYTAGYNSFIGYTGYNRR
jgi:hypothetical protein